ncbi:uncharacterized protein LOC111634345 [Centruroides sculpturatus]|uniref:uncharacterized protein LOC111634345 n=1 Tax=Centruroides sculpturatus TaxID=218467 RepID=UPI000C6ED03F|nr:uncharacterized protein LOC111634345 [Centruroides sculpturatus]
MAYAAGTWYTAAEKGVIKRKLLSAQRIALLRITKAFRTTSTDALLVIAGEPPIDLIIKEQALKYMCRQGLPITINGIPYDGMLYERKPSAKALPKPYERGAIGIAEEAEIADTNVFTDGSRIEDRVGASYTVFTHGTEIHQGQYRLADHCSVFQAELFAILMAVKWCISSSLTSSFIIHTDSRAAIQAMQQYIDTSQLSIEIKTLIRENKSNIKVRWVKAHVGIMGNERADALAKGAIEFTEIAYGKIPLSFIKKQLRQQTIEEWQERWTYSEKGRYTYWLLPSIEERIKDLKWLPVDFLRTQLYSNHCNTKEYLNRIGKDQESICDCEDDIESLEHLLTTCIKYENERMQLHLVAAQTFNTDCTDLYMLIRNKDIIQDLKNFTRSILSKS